MKTGRLWLGLAACCACARCFADSYDLNPTAVTGSARHVALGGANIALPTDYGAVFINPAGLGGITDTGIDFGSDSNQIDNFVVTDLANPKSKTLNDPINYSYAGARYVSENGWGFGFATQTPFRIDDSFNGDVVTGKHGTQFINNNDQTEIQVDNNTYSLGVGKSFLDKRMAVGMTINYVQVKESYDFTPVRATTAPVHAEGTNDAFSVDLGMLARPWPWLYVGAVYKMGYEVGFDDKSRNPPQPAFPTIAPFKNAKVPDRLSLGFAWVPHNMFRLYAQSTYTNKMRDTFIVGSGVTPNSGSVAAGRNSTVDGHWGAEFVAIDRPDLNFKVWAGGYYEDTGLSGGFTRYHRTAGFGLSPWFLSLNMAIDDTNLYDNFVVGFGVDLLQLASRIANKYGWKLPV